MTKLNKSNFDAMCRLLDIASSDVVGLDLVGVINRIAERVKKVGQDLDVLLYEANDSKARADEAKQALEVAQQQQRYGL